MIKTLLKSTLLSCAMLFGTSAGINADNGSTFVANRTDFRDESIYFLMTTRFYDGDPANNVLCWDNQKEQIAGKDPCWRGDFAGIIEKLDYIKALGFTAIWITPVVQNASGYDYHGYHAMDFSRVDCRYLSRTDQGSDKDVDFKTLIDAAHAKGIKVILDIVLNHTGNFGEEHLMKEFTRDTNIATQGNLDYCMLPNYDVLPADYLDNEKTQYQTRLALMKNTDGQNHDKHNYWHHVANAWNWDEPSRWWGQIAGDCVDLNTENPAVSAYLVKCYGEFIKLGVDGFRIDTSGHMARLTLNKSFIPQFTQLGKEYAAARQGAGLGSAPFYMFGEVCARFGGVTYRDQPNLSPYYYTWASDASVLGQWNDDASWWDNQVVKEGAEPLGNMTLCLQEANSQPTSDNAILVNGAYHAPDYSKASGFNVIDFPVHYNFTNAGSAYGMATSGDQYYNDATWNVVYVDSHDYSPQPNDGIRFAGGTDQWAENMTWMFLFRGIPCIYYGSEVEFMKGAPIDKGPNGPLSATGRAYFGQNLEGTVTTTDFGQFTADGQVAKTLNHPLSKHLERLNRIRQAVPALRKGQYSTEGCSAQGGFAWKKAYKAGGVDSYALVCMNGGATFTGIPDGTYVDCVTGDTKTVSGGTLTVSSPGNQGNARVYVLNGPGKIGEDGPFLYAATPAPADNSSLATDPGTSWVEAAAVAQTGMTFSPNGGTFTSESQEVKVSLTKASRGWYQVNGGSRVSVDGQASFTIGAGDPAGTTYTVNWGATPSEGGEETTGSVTFKKVGTYTPAVTADETSVFYETSAKRVGIWVWTETANYTGGDWNRKPDMEYMGMSTTGRNIYKWTYTGSETAMPSKVIFLPDGEQSKDLEYRNHGYYIDNVWNHEVSADPEAVSVILSQGSASFGNSMTVTATVKNATGVYTTDGSEPTAGSASFAGSREFTFAATTTLKVGALKDGKVTCVKTATYTKSPASAADRPHAYFVNDGSWGSVYAWVWDADDTSHNYTGGSWPGVVCSPTGRKSAEGYDIWEWTYDGTATFAAKPMIIFSNGSGKQTADLSFADGGYYNSHGATTGIEHLPSVSDAVPMRVYNLRGQLIATVNSIETALHSLPAGIYIINGKKYATK
ncbi:MAG: starch-binding protein [Prevotella sp.]|nr:starch-binding protein [Prevotella sp.]